MKYHLKVRLAHQKQAAWFNMVSCITLKKEVPSFSGSSPAHTVCDRAWDKPWYYSTTQGKHLWQKCIDFTPASIFRHRHIFPQHVIFYDDIDIAAHMSCQPPTANLIAWYINPLTTNDAFWHIFWLHVISWHNVFEDRFCASKMVG